MAALDDDGATTATPPVLLLLLLLGERNLDLSGNSPTLFEKLPNLSFFFCNLA